MKANKRFSQNVEQFLLKRFLATMTLFFFSNGGRHVLPFLPKEILWGLSEDLDSRRKLLHHLLRESDIPEGFIDFLSPSLMSNVVCFFDGLQQDKEVGCVL